MADFVTFQGAWIYRRLLCNKHKLLVPRKSYKDFLVTRSFHNDSNA